MKYTNNLGLLKPESTDFYDVNNQNDNMDIIDEEIKKLRKGSAVYLTQAEYDALPDSKLTDDVEYRITDANADEPKASNLAYDNTHSGIEAVNVQGAIDEISDSLDWKSAGQVKGTTALTLPTNYNELYIYVSIGGGDTSGGYVEFSPKKIMLKDTAINLHGGKTVIGDGAKRYSRSTTISISKTTVKISEIHYSQGTNSSTQDTNVVSDSELFVFYR